MTKHTPKRVHLLPLAGRVRIGDWTIKMTHCKKIPKRKKNLGGSPYNEQERRILPHNNKPICYGVGYTKLGKT
jgi:hypothetical protein